MTLSRIRRDFGVPVVFILLAALVAPPVGAASKSVDLDGNGSDESVVILRVLQSWPPKIQNRVINRGPTAQTFNWRNAGPGGFASRAQPSGEVRWTWETAQTVYSYSGTACKNDMCTFLRSGEIVGGAFRVPGRTLTSGSATSSNASLTSSLIQSFSPGETLIECSSEVAQLANGNFAYETTCINLSDETLSFDVEPQPLGCCDEPNQIRCEAYDGWDSTQNEVPIVEDDPSTPEDESISGQASVCVDYLESESNCGDCGIQCEDIEFCSNGACSLICDDAQFPDYCGDGAHDRDALCTDFEIDPDNCGGCGIPCNDSETCVAGVCEAICDDALSWCGGLPHDPPTAECSNLLDDPENCGACGNACNSSSICTDGFCDTCPRSLKDICDNECTNLKNDPENCGGCGISCDSLCPDSPAGTNVCSNGRSCRCGNSPKSIDLDTAFPLDSKKSGREAFDDRRATDGKPRFARTSSGAILKDLPPAAEVCDPATSVPASDPVLPGESFSICSASPYLPVERDGSVTACGPGIPGGSPVCGNQIGTQGIFQQFVPGDALPSAVSLSVVGMTVDGVDGNGLIQAGEDVCFSVEVAQSGTATLTSLQATLVSEAVDLDCGEIDEVDCVPDNFNPASVKITQGTSTFGDLDGIGQVDTANTSCDVPLASDDQSLVLTRTSDMQFCVQFPEGHPADIVRPFELQFVGLADGQPFGGQKSVTGSDVVPFAVGVAGQCDIVAGDFPDTVDGFDAPLAALVAVENGSAPLPSGRFGEGQVLPLTLRLGCGGSEVTAQDVDYEPRIVGLSGATAGDLNLPANSSFAFDPNVGWVFDLDLAGIGLAPDSYEITVRINDVRDYRAAFVVCADGDNDTICDDVDNCLGVSNQSQTDTDSDGAGDACDICPVDVLDDRDGDGVCDSDDQCPDDSGKALPGQCGCGISDVDSDGDGTADCLDSCPADGLKVEPGECGCGIADDDTDLDGVLDCNESCPTDPDKLLPSVCGCGVPDGIDGLESPMAVLTLVGDGDPVYPNGEFNLGNTRPMKMGLDCNDVIVTDQDLATAPEIVRLFHVDSGTDVDISVIDISDNKGPNPDSPFFRFNRLSDQWIYNLRTDDLPLGQLEITIRIGDHDYHTGFRLR